MRFLFSFLFFFSVYTPVNSMDVHPTAPPIEVVGEYLDSPLYETLVVDFFELPNLLNKDWAKIHLKVWIKEPDPVSNYQDKYISSWKILNQLLDRVPSFELVAMSLLGEYHKPMIEIISKSLLKQNLKNLKIKNIDLSTSLTSLIPFLKETQLEYVGLINANLKKTSAAALIHAFQFFEAKLKTLDLSENLGFSKKLFDSFQLPFQVILSEPKKSSIQQSPKFQLSCFSDGKVFDNEKKNYLKKNWMTTLKYQNVDQARAWIAEYMNRTHNHDILIVYDDHKFSFYNLITSTMLDPNQIYFNLDEDVRDLSVLMVDDRACLRRSNAKNTWGFFDKRNWKLLRDNLSKEYCVSLLHAET